MYPTNVIQTVGPMAADMPRSNAVGVAAGEMTERIAHLEKAADELAARIEPILMPESPHIDERTMGVAKPNPPRSSLASCLADYNDRIEAVTRRLTALARRAEL